MGKKFNGCLSGHQRLPWRSQLGRAPVAAAAPLWHGVPAAQVRTAAGPPPSFPLRQSHREVLDPANLPSRAEIGLPEDKVVYACANQL